MDWIIQILGSRYVFEGFSLILTFLESQFAISLFCNKLHKRYGFWIRVLMMLPVCAVACYLLAIANTELPGLFVRILCYLLIDGLNLAFTVFCWEGRVEQILLPFSAGLAAYQVGNKLYPLLQTLCGINDRETISLFPHAGDIYVWEWIMFYGLRIAVYVLLSLLFRPREALTADKGVRRNVMLLSVGTVAIVNVLVCAARVFEYESMALNIVVKLFTIASGLVVLIISAGLLSGSEKERQITVLNQLMKQEKAQFDSIKANMDAINMKCHDLKHIIGKLEGKLTDSETDALREAIRFYDANINTGNEVLDVVLCEKAVLCEKNHIIFSCMADGEAFAFLSAVQTYSLFGNIMDNAIEALQHVEDPDRKVISLTCTVQNGCPTIEESNYYDRPLIWSGGIPSTIKEDPGRHGFGVKSIRYIAEQNGGALELAAQDDMFFLKVTFPKQNA